ncbi:MAG: tetratricopeptide repeat protein [Candidatus Paceibacterota bacterium]|jgi:tetratricopeptide (TPR) repeat protein
MNKNGLLIIGGIVVMIIIAGIAQFLFSRPADSSLLPTSFTPVDSDGVVTQDVNAVSTTSKSNNPSSRPTAHPLSLVGSDQVASWSFKGAYAGNPELMVKAEAEITRLSDLVGEGTYPDVTLFVGIAGQYELLGDGRQAYDYLGRAVRAGETTALPWHNLGVLMERLGAYKTARVAYERATILQPELKAWQYAYIEFLILRMKDDTATIEKAFAAAQANLGETSDILQLRSEWEKS